MKHGWVSIARLLVFLPFLFVAADADVQINCTTDSSSMISNSSEKCTIVLESLNNVNTSSSDQDILLQTREYLLKRVLLFKTVRNIRFVGHNTTIKCIGEDTGLAFMDSQNIGLYSVVINGCGGLFNSTSTNLSDTLNMKTLVSRSAIYFKGCTNVILDNVHVKNSTGTGISMYNTNGLVHFIQSQFKFNGYCLSEKCRSHPKNGGVYVEFSLCDPGVLYKSCNPTIKNRVNAIYEFQDCYFESNIAQTINSNKYLLVKLIGVHNKNNQQSLGRGGGLALNFLGRVKNISLSIQNCTFLKNVAISGGGLNLIFKGTTSDVRVVIERSNFIGNIANISGGAVAYTIISNTVQNTSVIFYNCILEQNMANNGGGLLLLYNSLVNTNNRQNSLLIDSVCFNSNSAKYGSAVDALLYAPSGYNGPNPVFKDCIFKSNGVTLRSRGDVNSSSKQNFYGIGTFTVSKLSVDFNESVNFEKNDGIPLWALSSKLTFNTPMKATFIDNRGIEGGAIGLVSFSVLIFHDNVHLRFIRNSGVHNGGAIYSFQYGKQQMLGAALQCPLQYVGNRSIGDRNISMYFEDNSLFNIVSEKSESGPSIYMTTLEPCVLFCKVDPEAQLTVENMFSCIGNLIFNSSKKVPINKEVSTAGQMFTLNKNYTQPTLYLVPGKVFDLPLTTSNDLGFPLLHETYKAQISSSEIVIDPAYQLISQRTLKVYGPEGANSTIYFESTGHNHFLMKMDIELLPCPPGFYINYLSKPKHDTHKSYLSCTCNWEQTSHAVYQGVSCNSAAFEAQIRHIYWIGYVPKEPALPKHLYTALCPQQFCYSNLNISPFHVLPFNASNKMLNDIVCGPNRRGVLCGECTKGNTVFYHSLHFKCAPTHLCHIGFVLFLLSEIVPVTIMFVVIVLLNINFSSGALNGFILFAQVLDSLSIDAYGMLEFQLVKSRPFYHMTLVYALIYRVLNLDFFTEDKLSFCLWKGATTLDMLAFKFVAVLYAFMLILVTTLILNKCKLRVKFCRSLRIATIKSYIIHGLSAFLITCYIKCAQVAFHILIPGRLMGMPPTSTSEKMPQFRVVLYSGNIEYLSSEHWPYAFPAFLIILIVCLPPPLLLIWYPLGRQAVAKLITICRKHNFWLRNRSLNSCPSVNVIDKLKPLLDSFQSCYKDNCRFFAGLQFAFRLVILGTFNFTETPLIFYTAVEVEILLMLVVHMICWPYRKRWHNILDTLIYSNLIIVNAFTMFIYSSSINFSSTYVYEAAVVQTLLIYLPLIYIIGYTATRLCRVLKPRVLKKKKRTTTALDDGFPARLFQNDYDTSYHLENM